MFPRKAIKLFLFVLACTSLIAAPALTEPRYQGNDVSYASNSPTYVQICDRERDGRTAFASYWASGNAVAGYVEDHNGADSGCSSEAPSFGSIQWHKTCEPVAGCTRESYH